jgi:putative transposase
MADRYAATYPSAMKCLLADREGLTACLRFPAGHHHRVRHSNFIGRTFGETRRRTKVIGGFPARPAASPSCGPCWTGPPAAGGV